MQKEGRALCYTAGLLWIMQEYSKDSNDAEAIPAYYRSKWTIQMLLQAAATLAK